jgi:hypothetical protein
MEYPINNVCLSFQCPMKWSSMQARSGTERFCSQCNLEVTDFTNATKEQFIEKLKTSSGQVCGRFKPSQMNANYLNRIAATLALTTALACTPEPITQPLEKPIPFEVGLEEETLMGDVAFPYDSLGEQTYLGVVMIVEDDSVNTQDVKK